MEGSVANRMYVAQPITWTDRGVVILDQRRLPSEEISHTYTDYREVARAIRDMEIRGAPAIGVAAAMGVAIGVLNSPAKLLNELQPEFAQICDELAKTRPTAVDLFWALERMKARFAELTARKADVTEIKQAMVAEAQQVHLEKKATDEAISRFGAEFMPRDGQVMTQCNAGALATGGIGTALGVIRVAVEQGKALHVLVPETRPYLQGARLTAWELHEGGVPLTLITDNMVGHFMKSGGVGAVVVGADRIAVQPGGCAGLRYNLFFDDRTLDGDLTAEFGGVKLTVDRMSAPYIEGASIDFVDTIEKQGFTIDNPNATGSCACGDSFN